MRTGHFHPWHDVPAGPNPPDVVTAVIEIPTNERNKYELDKQLGVYRLDRVLHSAVHYPGDYGFIPRTLGDDDDPLDILVLMTVPVFTGCLLDARPVGLFHLVDRGRNDEKVLAVPVSDPFADHIQSLDDIPPHALKEIEHFFQVYKDLEGVTTRTRGFEGADAARQVIVEAMAHYGKRYGTGKSAAGRKRSVPVDKTDKTVKSRKVQRRLRKSRPR
jgi:inorganic pyrophosphatase